MATLQFERVPSRIWLIALLVVAAGAGVLYASWPHIAGSSDNDASSGGVPVVPETMAAALTSAADRVGFTPLIPGSLPTEADDLVLVDASAGPPGAGGGLKLVELIYRGAEPRTIDGQEVYSTLEMFETNVRLAQANGELFAADLAGYEVYRDVVSTDSAGEPAKVTYTARNDDWTFTMDFTGDQPDEAGLERLLSSLRPFEK